MFRRFAEREFEKINHFVIMFLKHFQFNARAPRIEKLQNDIEQFAEALAVEQKLQNSIRSETYEYVCQLQQSASMLAIPDSERRYESSCNVRSGNDESSYGQRNERVSCVFNI